MAIPVAYGSYQAEPHLLPDWATSVTYTRVHSKAGSLTHWARPEIKPTSSWILIGFWTRWATMGTPFFHVVLKPQPLLFPLQALHSASLTSLCSSTWAKKHVTFPKRPLSLGGSMQFHTTLPVGTPSGNCHNTKSWASPPTVPSPPPWLGSSLLLPHAWSLGSDSCSARYQECASGCQLPDPCGHLYGPIPATTGKLCQLHYASSQIDAAFCGVTWLPGEDVLGQTLYHFNFMRCWQTAFQPSILTSLETSGYILLPLMDSTFPIKSMTYFPNPRWVRFSPIFYYYYLFSL